MRFTVYRDPAHECWKIVQKTGSGFEQVATAESLELSDVVFDNLNGCFTGQITASWGLVVEDRAYDSGASEHLGINKPFRMNKPPGLPCGTRFKPVRLHKQVWRAMGENITLRCCSRLYTHGQTVYCAQVNEGKEVDY